MKPLKKIVVLLAVCLGVFTCSNDNEESQDNEIIVQLSVSRYEDPTNTNVIIPKSSYINYTSNYQFTSYFKYDDTGNIDRLTHIVGDDGSGVSTIISFDDNGLINVLYQQDAITSELVAETYIVHENGITYVGDENETFSINENIELNDFESLGSTDDILLAEGLNQNKETLEQLFYYTSANDNTSNRNANNSNSESLFSGFQMFLGNLVSFNLGVAASFNSQTGASFNSEIGANFNSEVGVSFNTGIGQTVYDWILYDGCNIFSTCELLEDGTFTCGSLYLNVICWDNDQVMEVLENTTNLTVDLCGSLICTSQSNSILGCWAVNDTAMNTEGRLPRYVVLGENGSVTFVNENCNTLSGSSADWETYSTKSFNLSSNYQFSSSWFVDFTPLGSHTLSWQFSGVYNYNTDSITGTYIHTDTYPSSPANYSGNFEMTRIE